MDIKFKSPSFGDITLGYRMKDIDGTNLEEIVVIYDHDNNKRGEIYGIQIEDITEDDILENYY